jgi:hypothetical protein
LKIFLAALAGKNYLLRSVGYRPIGMAGAGPVVPDPAAFGAAGQPKAEQNEANNGGKTL